jgi:protein-S-isoprenylcysteine O-methyltransferase Ste14
LLALDLAFLFAAFGLRTWLQWRRTGDTGWRLGRPHSRAEAAARALMLGSAPLLVVGAFAAPASHSATAVLGVGLMFAGLSLTLAAQWRMGAAWRIGVDPSERTELVQEGIYAAIRNPIYSGMALFALGQALVTPTAWAWAAVAALCLGVQIQVRGVEEPYLIATHGARFESWAARAGRFAPYLGRLRS